MPAGSGLPIQGSYQWLRLTKESTFGVYDPAGESIWVVLAGDNGFNAQYSKVRTVIRSADTSNRKRNNIATKYLLDGSFNTPLYPSQAQFLLDCASTLSATPPYGIPSMTADFFDSQVPRRWLGGMVQSCTINSDATTQYANLNMSWFFSKVDDAALSSGLPRPGCAELPMDDPYLFNDLAGTFQFGATPATGSATLLPVTIFDSLNVTIQNILDRRHYEMPFVSYCQWAGRDVSLATNLAYLDTTWRDLFEDQTPLTMQASFAQAGAPTLNLFFQSRNYVASRAMSYPLAAVVTQQLSAESFFDCNGVPGPTDFGFTIT